MKRKALPLVLAAILAFCAAASFAQKIDVYSRPLQTEPSRDYQALHYRIALDFDVAKTSFTGENTITLAPFREGLTSIGLDAETFSVTGVRLADGTPLAFKQAAGRLTVELPKPYPIGAKVSFTVAYRAAGLGASGDRKKGINFVEATPANPALIVARSFPDGARHWFPCYDHPNGKVTQEILATVPREYRVLSNGRLLAVTENPGRGTKTYHWSQDKPHATYLSALIAGPYVVTEAAPGPVPIAYWYYEKDAKDAPIAFKKTPDIIAFLGKTYGYDYPWDKYDQVIVPGGGGTETTSATMLTQTVIHDAKAEKDFSIDRWLVTHEAAHHWWGDLVTCRDWGHTWINESFGTSRISRPVQWAAARRDGGCRPRNQDLPLVPGQAPCDLSVRADRRTLYRDRGRAGAGPDRLLVLRKGQEGRPDRFQEDAGHHRLSGEDLRLRISLG